MKSFEISETPLDPQEDVNEYQELDNKTIEAIKKIQQDVEDFLNQDFDNKDIDEITEKYKQLARELGVQKSNLWDKNDKENKLEKELDTLSNRLYSKIDKIYSDFVENQLIKNERSISDFDVDIKQVESEANYQGNMLLCMLSRIKSPEISAQLQELLYLDRKFDLFEKNVYTRERVFDELYEDVITVTNDTPVTFVGDMPSASYTKGVRENMDVAFCDLVTDTEYGNLQKSYIEAHEKGHYIRMLRSSGVYKYFSRTIDLNEVTFSQEYFDLLKADAIRRYGEEAESITFDRCRSSIADYFKAPFEIIERMSQLKNYFGFSGNEIFTKKHLEYAREHYVKDTGLDNYMEIFFRCITPETESHFLNVMNNCGV